MIPGFSKDVPVLSALCMTWGVQAAACSRFEGLSRDLGAPTCVEGLRQRVPEWRKLRVLVMPVYHAVYYQQELSSNAQC